MPPTYSPWWKAFEALGRAGFVRRGRLDVPDHSVGSPLRREDCAGGSTWERFRTAEALFAAWGPPPASPWAAYHRPTLFATLDDLKDGQRAFPMEVPGLIPRDAPRDVPAWAGRARARAAPGEEDGHTAVVLDLPGRASVALGAWLALRAGHQPVATFNNWAHPRGLVDMGGVLAALLYFVAWVREAADSHQGAPRPPVFLLDRDRLGRRMPKPEDFDNRYHLLDADLPSGAALRKAGVARVVYVAPEGDAWQGAADPDGRLPRGGKGRRRGQAGQPLAQRDDLLHRAPLPQALPAGPAPPPPGTGGATLPDMPDLNGYLHDLPKTPGLGLALARARLDAWAWAGAEDWWPAVRKTVFTTVKDPTFRGFRRSAAGGFGALVPEESSGGG